MRELSKNNHKMIVKISFLFQKWAKDHYAIVVRHITNHV